MKKGNIFLKFPKTNLYFFISVTIFTILIVQDLTFSQTLVQDTLIISFKDISDHQDFRIDSILDRRDEQPNIIGIYEKSKYLFVPIDLLLYLKNPITIELFNRLKNSDSLQFKPNIKLVIDEFSLSKKSNSLFYPRYHQQSTISIYYNKADSNSIYLGELLHETSHRTKVFGDNLQKGFNQVVQNWQTEFISDLNKISNSLQQNQKPKLYNLRLKNQNSKSTNMIVGIDFMVGTESTIWDGEIYFSNREAQKRFFRSGYILRFRNSKLFDSIEYGISTDNIFHRFTPNILLRIKSQLMFGFNRWNDFKSTKHKLWDAFILDHSLSQTLIYNPLDKQSILFGIGVFQNVYYVYSKKINFQFGLVVNFGLKL